MRFRSKQLNCYFPQVWFGKCREETSSGGVDKYLDKEVSVFKSDKIYFIIAKLSFS